jgi:hypothetical protein
LQLPHSILLPLKPRALENLPISEVEGALPVLEAVYLLPFVLVPVGPSKYPTTLDDSVPPIAHIFPFVDVGECTLPVKLAVPEYALVDSRLRCVDALTIFDTVAELPLVGRGIRKLLLPET